MYILKLQKAFYFYVLNYYSDTLCNVCFFTAVVCEEIAKEHHYFLTVTAATSYLYLGCVMAYMMGLWIADALAITAGTEFI